MKGGTKSNQEYRYDIGFSQKGFARRMFSGESRSDGTNPAAKRLAVVWSWFSAEPHIRIGFAGQQPCSCHPDSLLRTMMVSG
jgi:hypothetical protein